ncbi:hypothetical protein FGB62_77g07 [Gracilaria domingensis]|nr:hypothetical protein FGB62_77g07 [Gracilaria domingensis]
MAFLRSCLEEDEHSEHSTQCAQVAGEESPNEVASQSAAIGTQRSRQQAATVERVRWRAAQKSMEDMEEEDTRLDIRTIREVASSARAAQKSMEDMEEEDTRLDIRTIRGIKTSTGMKFLVKSAGWPDEVVDATKLDRWCGQKVTKWCAATTGNELTTDVAYRLGLLEDDESFYGEPWSIQEVMLSGEITSENGVLPTQYYCRNRTESTSWYRIQLHTLLEATLASALYRLQIMSGSCDVEVSRNLDGFLAVDMDENLPFKCIEAIDAWCMNHVGSAVDIRCPGARTKSPGFCLQLALVNAISRVVDMESAQSVLADKVVEPMVCMTDACKWLELYMPYLELIRVKVAARDLDSVWNSIETKQFGVLLLRLKGGSDVVHVVCIDLDKGELLDSSEAHPQTLSKPILMAATGSNSGVRLVSEIRELKRETNKRRKKGSRAKCRSYKQAKKKKRYEK